MSDASRPSAARRQVFAGAAGAGALAAAAALLPSTKTDPQPTAEAAVDPKKQQGYRLTEHVRRYYETTRV